MPLLFGLGWIAARFDIKQMLSETRNLPDSYFVVSLANNPIEEHGENMHYKLIATILPK